jgi:methionine biosynthesis protein MetW
VKYTMLSPDPDEAHAKVIALVPAGAHVLEVGAATGYITERLRAHGASVVAIEPELAAVEAAAARGVEIRNCYVDDLLDDYRGTFDYALVADVVEHVNNPQHFLRTTAELLKPSGKLILSVPNIAHWTARLSVARGRFNYTERGIFDDTRVRFYTAATLETLLEGSGFRVVLKDAALGLFDYPRVPSLMRRIGLHKLIRPAARRLAKVRPALFGYQFIWLAERRDKAPARG